MSPFEQCWPVSLHEPQAYQIASTGFATLPPQLYAFGLCACFGALAED
jgi:hypothetical protein